jgi:hypothetical protein
MKKLILSTGIGAGLMYFFDPREGNRRRKEVVQRGGGFLRRLVRRGQRTGQAVASQTYGVTQKVVHRKEEEKDLSDETLAAKVESEIFRDPEAPKGRVNVNVVDGVVYLRGEVGEDLIQDLEAATRKVTGVKDVENLLHTPGSQAPATPES